MLIHFDIGAESSVAQVERDSEDVGGEEVVEVSRRTTRRASPSAQNTTGGRVILL